MAVSYLFDTKYHESSPVGPADDFQQKCRVIIGDKSGTVTGNGGEIELFSPGLKLNYSGDQDRFMASFMGSTLSFTARLDDAQLAIWDGLLDLNEGEVFCLFFTDWLGAIPYWYGHLVIEESNIRVQNEYHTVDLTFTDGLASLRGVPWRDESGNPYTGFRPLRFFLREIVSKLPAYPAFSDYIRNVQGGTNVNVVREVGFPDPRVDTDNNYDFHSGDSKLYYIRVRAETFDKPKKQIDRTRQLAAAPDYFDTASVLEDICKTFGATAALFEGFLNLGCRLDISTMKGENVVWHAHSYNPSADTWLTTTNVTAGTENVFDTFFKDAEADDTYEVLEGAVKRRSLPIYQVNLTHEEGGSDWLVADGYYLNPNISHLDPGQVSLYAYLNSGSNVLTQQTGQSQAFFSIDGNRKDLWYVFYTQSSHPITTPPPGASYTIPWYQSPASVGNYTGFEARTVTDLEVQSGEEIRIQFGGVALFDRRNAINISSSENFKKYHVGNTLVCRIMVQFKDTDGYYWRLRRPVETHVLTDSSEDWIRIDNIQLYYDPGSQEFTYLDRYYFRKLYGTMRWVRSDDSDYSDSWYEVIAPHGDNLNSGDGWGTTAHALTDAQYGSQTNYAPIGCELKGSPDEGEAVTLKEGDGDTFIQYFKEDISVQMPYHNNTLVDFEEFYFEQGFELYRPNNGPRPNTTSTGLTYWNSSAPTWRTPYADGTGAIDANSGNNDSYLTRPMYLHLSGVRIAVGDGSESSDFVTKIDGGDGYEIMNIGSSRLGSRLSFVNTHVGGTLWARTKDSSADGDFDFANEAYNENLQWRGHRAGNVAGSNVPTTVYDSLHSYVCNAYIDLFGESRVVYDMSLIPGSAGRSTLKNPFAVLAMSKLISNKDITEYLMPLSYEWTLSEGISGSFLKVGQTRERAGITEYVSPVEGKGTTVPGGVTPGLDLANSVSQSRIVTSKITVSDNTNLDTIKSDVLSNNSKVTFPGFGRTEGKAMEGHTQTINEIQDLDAVRDATGTSNPVEVIKTSPELLTLVARSDVGGYEGVFNFTVQDMWTAIVTAGWGDLDDAGYVEPADYTGATSGAVGDLDDDGSVGVSDLLDFLTLFGNIYYDDNAAFSQTDLRISTGGFVSFTTSAQTLPFSSTDISNVDPGGISINVLDATDQIEFLSGATYTYPITAWTQKTVKFKADFNTALFRGTTTLPYQSINFYAQVETYAGTTLSDSWIVYLGQYYKEVPEENFYVNPAPLGWDGLTFIDPAGNIADPSVTKIRVSLGAEPANDTTTDFEVEIFSVHIGLIGT